MSVQLTRASQAMRPTHGTAVQAHAGGLRFPIVACCIAIFGTSGAVHAQDKPQAQFDIGEYRVVGNTVLDTKTVEKAVYGYLGPAKTLQDVEKARAALETAYHERGFGTVFVDIPEQSVDDGVVRLKVTEARLRQVRVTGARYFSDRQMLAQVPAAAAGSVPNLPELQKQLGNANAETADRSITPVLKAGPTPGTVDLNMRVQDHLPFHGSVELNNQYTANTTQLRALTLMSYDDAFGRLDTASLQFQTAPGHAGEADVLALAYLAHLGGNGNKLSFTYVDSNSSVASVGTLGVIGDGKMYSARYMIPMRLTTQVSDAFSIGADYKDFAQNVVVDPTTQLDTPISYVNFVISYGGASRLERQLWTWSTGVNFGVKGLGNSETEFADKCFGCRPDYMIWKADGSLDQSLPKDFHLVLRVAGQYSGDPVASNEQFLLGGAQSVRGYLEAEELGDVGSRESLELRVPPLHLKSLNLMSYVFVDNGHVRLQQPLPGEPGSQSLTSVGLGVDFDLFKFLSGTFVWALPLVDGTYTQSDSSRWLFAVRSSW